MQIKNTRMKYVHYDPQDVNMHHPPHTNLVGAFAIHKEPLKIKNIFDISFAALSPEDAVGMKGSISYKSFSALCFDRIETGCNSVVPYWLWHETIALFDNLLKRFPDAEIWFSGRIPLPSRLEGRIQFFLEDRSVPYYTCYPLDILKHYLIYGGIEQPPFRSRVNDAVVVA